MKAKGKKMCDFLCTIRRANAGESCVLNWQIHKPQDCVIINYRTDKANQFKGELKIKLLGNKL